MSPLTRIGDEGDVEGIFDDELSKLLKVSEKNQKQSLKEEICPVLLAAYIAEADYVYVVGLAGQIGEMTIQSLANFNNIALTDQISWKAKAAKEEADKIITDIEASGLKLLAYENPRKRAILNEGLKWGCEWAQKWQQIPQISTTEQVTTLPIIPKTPTGFIAKRTDGKVEQSKTSGGALAIPMSDVKEVMANVKEVTYDKNGADDGTEPDDQIKIKEVDLKLHKNVGNLSKFRSIWVGWNTKPDGTGIPYAGGDSYKVDAKMTLYAQWQDLPQNMGGSAAEGEKNN